MIDLKIFTPLYEKHLDIKKYNRIFLNSNIGLTYLFNDFNNCINNNKDYKIFIGNKPINSKNTYFFSFLSVSDIIFSLENKKNTIFNIYTNLIIDKNICLIEKTLENYLINISEKLNKENILINYNLNNDLKKIFSSSYSVNLKNKEIDEYTKILCKILNDIIKENFDKKFILLINSSVLNFDFLKYENVYVFDINKTKNSFLYNFISSDSFENFDSNLLLKEIINKWPMDVDETYLKSMINNYYFNYYNKKSIYAYNKKDFIFFYLISKILNKNINIVPINIELDNVIKSFLINN